MKFIATLFLALVTFSLFPTANAAIVTLAENTHSSTEGAGDSTYSVGSGGGTNWGAENFSLSGAFNVLSISHVGIHNSNLAPTSMDWRIYSSSLTGPDSIIASGMGITNFTTANEGVTSFGESITRYTMNILPVLLGPGNYWIAFHNSGINGNLSWTKANGGSSLDSKSAVSENNGNSWSSTNIDYAFRIEGEAVVATPEPATLAIWTGLGLVGLLITFPRRKTTL